MLSIRTLACTLAEEFRDLVAEYLGMQADMGWPCSCEVTNTKQAQSEMMESANLLRSVMLLSPAKVSLQPIYRNRLSYKHKLAMRTLLRLTRCQLVEILWGLMMRRVSNINASNTLNGAAFPPV